jgi:hypothetical protein
MVGILKHDDEELGYQSTDEGTPLSVGCVDAASLFSPSAVPNRLINAYAFYTVTGKPPTTHGF